jgi:hypothetical protein
MSEAKPEVIYVNCFKHNETGAKNYFAFSTEKMALEDETDLASLDLDCTYVGKKFIECE